MIHYDAVHAQLIRCEPDTFWLSRLSKAPACTLYKGHWEIELLFRWIKRHLNLRKLIGNNENAIRLQVIAAMIAYILLRLARRLNSVTISHLRFAELVCQRLSMRNG